MQYPRVIAYLFHYNSEGEDAKMIQYEAKRDEDEGEF